MNLLIQGTLRSFATYLVLMAGLDLIGAVIAIFRFMLGFIEAAPGRLNVTKEEL